MYRPTRGIGHTVSDRAVARRGNIRATDAGVLAAYKRRGQILQPMRVGAGVIIDIGDNFTSSRLHSAVRRRRKAIVVGAYQSGSAAFCDGTRGVGGSVVHNDSFEIGIMQPFQCLQGLTESPGAIVTTNYDRDLGPRTV